MKNITNLTPEQVSRMTEWRDKWTAIGLSTEPANRAEAEKAIVMSYAAAGLAAPKIVWCGSPLSQGLTRAIVMNGGDSVRASVWDSVRASVWASVGDSVRASVGDSGYGQHDASWLAYYDYFREVCGLHDETRLLEGLTLLAQHAGWFIPHEKICWVSERHSVLHRDENGRLHCETGPALEYPDKYVLWMWHGIPVTEQIIMHPDTLTVEQIRSEENAEIRRCMVERIGYRRFVELSEMRTIHTDTMHSRFPSLTPSELVDNSDPSALVYVDAKEEAELLESALLRDFEDRPLRFVRLTCPSTGKVYIQRVRHDETRVYAAVGRSFGMSEEEYKNGRYFRQGDVLMWALDQSDGRIVQQHS